MGKDGDTMSDVSFQSKSVFYAPVWTDDYAKFISAMKKDPRYVCLPKTDGPQYMLPYINSIYRKNSLFMQFELKTESLPRLYMFQEWCNLPLAPTLSGVKVSCFSTGCFFVELHVTYDGLTLDQIADFSFHFKNATKGEDDAAKLINALPTILPPHVECEPFFTGAAFKKECKIFHQICTGDKLPADDVKRHLIHLRRGYHRNFAIPQTSGEYDMIYEPYDYDHWAGSQEGFVNLFNYTEDERTNSFLIKYKPVHLSRDYSFMYLILLNQRFSAIRYLDKISQLDQYTRRQKEKLSTKVFRLKTVFSFSVVSDDQLYQNIYSKMYGLLDIDRLLADIHDNEDEVETIQNHELLENEKMTSRFLFNVPPVK